MPELPLSSGGHRFGWFYRALKHTALGFSSIPGIKLAEPPPVDMHLAEFMPDVLDQGDLGACTAFTGVEDLMALLLQYYGTKVLLSPLFLYYMERQLDGTISEGDCGSTGETSCEAINQFGICLESTDPYTPATFNNAPTPTQLAEALKYRSGAYHSITNVQDAMTCINSGYRFRLGMSVYESFEDIGPDGLMPVPDPKKEQQVGGHEELVYGYDSSVKCPGANASGAFRVRNHWSKNWGLTGEHWMAFELFSPDCIVGPDLKIQHFHGPWSPKAMSA